MSAEKYLKVPDVAKRLLSSRKTVYRRLLYGEIPSFKEGGRLFVLASDLDAYLGRLEERKKGR